MAASCGDEPLIIRIRHSLEAVMSPLTHAALTNALM
jgi:hypothetical protein